MNITNLHSRHALFLDYDGTLAPIQENPDTVFMSDYKIDILLKTEQRMGGALAVISGRDVRDLALRVPDRIWRAGGHGADICPPGQMPPEDSQPAPEALVQAAEALCRKFYGVRLEKKGPVLALHYRLNPNVGDVLAQAVGALLSGQETYCLQAGKMVLELRPFGVHKGMAVRGLMKQAPFLDRVPVMVGDDTTDEDAMAVCLEMGGVAIRVGDGASIAPLRLSDSHAVWRWLSEALE
ncbi:MAG: trehalose-phosphatase [Hyphomonas sp.]